jgi:hypothetical protein
MNAMLEDIKETNAKNMEHNALRREVSPVINRIKSAVVPK